MDKYFYDKKEFNSDSDVYEFHCNIKPEFSSKDQDQIITIKKILVVTCSKNKIRGIYIDSVHPNCGVYLRKFDSSDYKNKKLDSNSIKHIINDLSKISIDKKTYFNKNSPIKLLDINGQKFYYYQGKYFNLNQDIYETIDEIIPRQIYKDNIAYHISFIDKRFIINKIRIVINTDFNVISEVLLDSPHPNSDIVFRSLCFNPIIKWKFFDKNGNINQQIYNLIKGYLSIYNLNHRYFDVPDRYIKIGDRANNLVYN